MKRLLTFALYYFLIFHFTCSPTPNNSSDPNANFFGMLMNIWGFSSFQNGQASIASTQVTGILRDANGDPLAFAVLDLSLLQGRSIEGNLTRATSDTRTTTDVDGAYTLNLRLGKFEIAVTKSDGTKLGSFSLDVVNATVPPTVSSTSNAFAVSGIGISSVGSAPPSITSAKIESITYTNSTIYQYIATVITPKIRGGKPTSCTISPALPTGLSLNSTTCVISGIPTVLQSATNYTVIAGNQGGSVTGNLTITINNSVPTGLSFANSPFVFTKNAPLAVQTPFFTGVIASCTVSPALPGGLSIDSTTCAISGTPTELKSTTNYTVTAGNTWGSVTTGIIITVNYAAPGGLSYNDSPYIFTKDLLIPSKTPTYSGTITSCTISPALPSGLELNTTTCLISGTPTVIQSATNYTVTAGNNGGSVSTGITITVNYAAPSGLSYSGSPYVFTKDALISSKTPTFSGTVTGCTTNPTLPSGLEINSTTCVINGIPTVISSTTNYTVTASNNGGSVFTGITITVNYAAPSGLSYSGSPYIFTKDLLISSKTPTFSGTVTSCTISPALTSGLGINSTTCAISGTPTVIQSATNYTVTAGNNGGSVSTGITITVNYATPSGLSYSGSPYIFTKDLLISSKTPTFSGTVTNCTISPALPSGLGINSTTCVISGTPTVIQSTTNYTVTASNNGGSVSTGIIITVNYAAPSGLSYSGSPYIFTKDSLISSKTPTFSGTVTSCTINPALPSGLGINSTTCAISGTPTVIQSSTNYTITASNNGGSVSTSITITVNYMAPSGLSYSGSPYIFTKDSLISSQTPTFSGTVTSCMISPALPTGLGINSTTCVISGTPTVIQSATNYTVTASNNGGSVTTGIITVNHAAPSGLSYSGSPYIFTKDSLISSQTPIFSGTVTSCTISPALPTGLGINSTTCVISGTPTVIQSATNYTVTASNNGGLNTFLLSIEVKPSPPTNLSYPSNSLIATVGKSLPYYNGIHYLIPTVSGSISNYSISPALPNGLSINSISGIFLGTPTVTHPKTDYIITVSNSGGIATFKITIAVYSNYTYTDNGNGTVTQSSTGLLWQKSLGSTSTYASDWNYLNNLCKNLSLGGRVWRLPRVDELSSLLEGSGSPSINIVSFPNTPYQSYGYWSSSSYAQFSNTAWIVGFYNGGILGYDYKYLNQYARCVTEQ